MFYSTDILHRGKKGFGIYWLAATLGAKGGTSYKKLSRKEVLECNLISACKNLAQPQEPLALRLTSNLLCGIARVYQQQYTIFLGDVTQFHATLKKAFTTAQTQKPADVVHNNDLPAHPSASTAAASAHLNLTPDPAIAQLGLDFEFDLGVDWSAIGAGGSAGEVRMELDLGEEGIETESVEAQANQSRRPRDKNVVRDKSLITLREPYKHYPGDFDYDDLDREGEEPLGELVEFGEGEGLLEGHSEELDQILREADPELGQGSRAGSAGTSGRRRSGGSGGAAGGEASSSAAGFFDVFDDPFDNHEFGGGGAGDFFGGQLDLEERVGREHVEGDHTGDYNDKEQFFMDDDFNVPVAAGEQIEDSFVGEGLLPGKRRSSEMDGDEAASQQGDCLEKQVKKPVPKKAKKTVHFDDDISLSDEHLSEMRRSYPERMAAERAKAERVKQDKLGAQKALDLLFGVPDHYGPGLADLWKRCMVDPFKPFDSKPQDLNKSRQKTGPGPQQEHQPGEEDAGNVEGGISQIKHTGGDDFDVFRDIGERGDAEFGLGENERDMGGMQLEDFDMMDVEAGRAGSAVASSLQQRNALLPWNVGTSDVGFGGDIGGFASSQVDSGGRFSVGKAASDKRRSRGGSLIPSQLGSGTPRGSALADPLEWGDQGDKRDKDDDGASSVPDAAIAIATLERESQNFLAYAKRKAEEEDQLHFSDIVPVASTDANAAAQALYHLLVVASKGLVKVKQDEPYAEIFIEVS